MPFTLMVTTPTVWTVTAAPAEAAAVSATPGSWPPSTGSPDAGCDGCVGTSDSWVPLPKMTFFAMSAPPSRDGDLPLLLVETQVGEQPSEGLGELHVVLRFLRRGLA